MKNYFLIVAITLAFWPPAISNAGNCCKQPIVCPHCKSQCKLSIEQVKEKKHRYEVECVPICIPKVRFPWEKCGPPQCAKTKLIYKLKKIEYKCEKCKYVWTPVCGACGNCTSASGDAPPSPPSTGLSAPAATTEAMERGQPRLRLAPAPVGQRHARRAPSASNKQLVADAIHLGGRVR